MPADNKNNFTTAARVALVQRGWTVTELARRINRPRATVSRVIHSDDANKFPKVRRAIARKLKLHLAA